MLKRMGKKISIPLIIIFLIGAFLLIINVYSPSVNACSCKDGNGAKCTGNCCYTYGTACSCYDFGTDDCSLLK